MKSNLLHCVVLLIWALSAVRGQSDAQSVSNAVRDQSGMSPAADALPLYDELGSRTEMRRRGRAIAILDKRQNVTATIPPQLAARDPEDQHTWTDHRRTLSTRHYGAPWMPYEIIHQVCD